MADGSRAAPGAGLQRIGLLVADGLTGIEQAFGQVYSGTPVQWCVTHIKRGLLARVRTEDKQELAEDLRQVFGQMIPMIILKKAGIAGNGCVKGGKTDTRPSGNWPPRNGTETDSPTWL